MDYLTINQLKVPAKIGVYSWEQQITRQLVFDIEFGIDNRQIAASDDIDNTLNYAQIATSITELLTTRTFKLVETVAECIAEHLLTTFTINTVKLRVTKPHPISNAASVTVTIERDSLSQKLEE